MWKKERGSRPHVRRFYHERGASLTGYGLIVGLIAIAAIVALRDVGTQVTALFQAVSMQMEGVIPDGTGGGGGNGGGGEEGEEEDPPSSAGTGPCPNNPPQAGDEGCDPGDGTIFVGLIDATQDSNQERIFMTPFDLNSGGQVMMDAFTDRGDFLWKTTLTATGLTKCTDSPLYQTGVQCFDGQSLTTQIVAASGVHPAAEACDALSFAGYGDWYLPSIQELKMIHTNLYLSDSDIDDDGISDIFGFEAIDGAPSGTSRYWSSSASSTIDALFMLFTNGNLAWNGKNTAEMSIRCVRR